MNQYETFSAEPAGYDTSDYDDGSFDSTRRRERSSSKFLVGCLVGCGGVILLLIVGLVVIGLMVGNWANNMVDQDPAAIRARTDKIATIDVPASFEPEGAVHVDIPFLGELGHFVFYRDDERDGALLLADVSDKLLQGQSAEQWAHNTSIQINETDIDDRDSLENAETESVTRTIRGQEVTFQITTGTRKGTEEKRIVASGNFPGRLGQSFFLMSTDAESLSIEDVKTVIDSIK